MKHLDPAAERIRLQEMYQYEVSCFQAGYRLVGGVDEAGRGPFVGPVSAACVILKQDFFLPGLNDSKKLSEPVREAMYEQILEQSVAYGVAMVDHQTIDEINILNATKLAMCQAISQLQPVPDYLLTDYVELPMLEIPQLPLIKGDSKSASIAAASVLAKVTRDRYMREAAEQYPEYGFLKNKGYGTKQHITALLEYGPCPIHRRSFIRKYLHE